MKHKVAFKTIGCRLNQFETNSIASEFKKNEYQIVDIKDNADIYVVNTCTVTSQSDHSSRNYISRVKIANPDALVIVTGCMVNVDRFNKTENETTIYLPNELKSSLFTVVDSYKKGEIVELDSLRANHFEYTHLHKDFQTRALLKIQDGCDNYCSFCIVPKARGRAISRAADDVINNLKQLIENGFKEIVITGVNIGRYQYQNTSFEQLLNRLLNVEGGFRIRISSIEPYGITDDFFSLIKHPKLCPHLHLCLQSGSDKILKLMNRKYSFKEFSTLIENIRSVKADFNITTDMIVGFPGETEEDFELSCQAAKDLRFSHIHIFKYSVRESTRAASLEQQIDEKTKNRRSEIMRNISDENKEKYRLSFVEKQQNVLVEKTKEDGMCFGYGEHYLPVSFLCHKAKKNDLVTVKIKGINNDNMKSLKGKSILSK